MHYLNYHVKLDPNHKAAVHPQQWVPVTLRCKGLDRMDMKLRIYYIDQRDCDQAIKREHYPIKEVVTRLPIARVFSVLDANFGFFQVKLDNESSRLCTFNSQLSRYHTNLKGFDLEFCSYKTSFKPSCPYDKPLIDN